MMQSAISVVLILVAMFVAMSAGSALEQYEATDIRLHARRAMFLLGLGALIAFCGWWLA